MDNQPLHIERRLYAGHWPIFCLMDGDRVILFRETEQQAQRELEANAKRSEAAKGNDNAAKAPKENSAATNSGTTVSPVHKSSKAKASASGTNRRAGEMLRDMDKAKGASQPNTNRGTTQCNDVTASAPTLSEIGITKRQSSDWQNMEAIT